MAVTKYLTGWLVVAAALATPLKASANPNDVFLRGLGRPSSSAMSDPAVRRYRAMTGELALAMTPKAMQPAETLGMSGFEFGVATTINNINEGAGYWAGQPGSPVFEGVAKGRDQPTSLVTPTLIFRKGLPMSIDIGASGTYLTSSRMFMLGTDVKIALHESYIRYFPAIAARASFNRLFGSEQLDVFTAEADLLASLAFGVKGVAQLTPFLGFGKLFSHVNSQVIDETPYATADADDQRGGARGSLYTLPTLEWHKNDFWKFFGGIRVIAAVATFTYSLDVGFLPYKFVDQSTVVSHSIKLGFDI